MFRSKSLLCCKQAALFSSKVVTNSKNTSWAKKFNQENKYLYGDLIETQEERRKRLTVDKVKTESNLVLDLDNDYHIRSCEIIKYNFLGSSACKDELDIKSENTVENKHCGVKNSFSNHLIEAASKNQKSSNFEIISKGFRSNKEFEVRSVSKHETLKRCTESLGTFSYIDVRNNVDTSEDKICRPCLLSNPRKLSMVNNSVFLSKNKNNSKNENFILNSPYNCKKLNVNNSRSCESFFCNHSTMNTVSCGIFKLGLTCKCALMKGLKLFKYGTSFVPFHTDSVDFKDSNLHLSNLDTSKGKSHKKSFASNENNQHDVSIGRPYDVKELHFSACKDNHGIKIENSSSKLLYCDSIQEQPLNENKINFIISNTNCNNKKLPSSYTVNEELHLSDKFNVNKNNQNIMANEKKKNNENHDKRSLELLFWSSTNSNNNTVINDRPVSCEKIPLDNQHISRDFKDLKIKIRNDLELNNVIHKNHLCQSNESLSCPPNKHIISSISVNKVPHALSDNDFKSLYVKNSQKSDWHSEINYNYFDKINENTLKEKKSSSSLNEISFFEKNYEGHHKKETYFDDMSHWFINNELKTKCNPTMNLITSKLKFYRTAARICSNKHYKNNKTVYLVNRVNRFQKNYKNQQTILLKKISRKVPKTNSVKYYIFHHPFFNTKKKTFHENNHLSSTNLDEVGIKELKLPNEKPSSFQNFNPDYINNITFISSEKENNHSSKIEYESRKFDSDLFFNKLIRSMVYEYSLKASPVSNNFCNQVCNKNYSHESFGDVRKKTIYRKKSSKFFHQCLLREDSNKDEVYKWMDDRDKCLANRCYSQSKIVQFSWYTNFLRKIHKAGNAYFKPYSKKERSTYSQPRISLLKSNRINLNKTNADVLPSSNRYQKSDTHQKIAQSDGRKTSFNYFFRSRKKFKVTPHKLNTLLPSNSFLTNKTNMYKFQLGKNRITDYFNKNPTTKIMTSQTNKTQEPRLKKEFIVDNFYGCKLTKYSRLKNALITQPIFVAKGAQLYLDNNNNNNSLPQSPKTFIRPNNLNSKIKMPSYKNNDYKNSLTKSRISDGRDELFNGGKSYAVNFESMPHRNQFGFSSFKNEITPSKLVTQSSLIEMKRNNISDFPRKKLFLRAQKPTKFINKPNLGINNTRKQLNSVNKEQGNSLFLNKLKRYAEVKHNLNKIKKRIDKKKTGAIKSFPEFKRNLYLLEIFKNINPSPQNYKSNKAGSKEMFNYSVFKSLNSFPFNEKFPYKSKTVNFPRDSKPELLNSSSRLFPSDQSCASNTYKPISNVVTVFNSSKTAEKSKSVYTRPKGYEVVKSQSKSEVLVLNDKLKRNSKTENSYVASTFTSNYSIPIDERIITQNNSPSPSSLLYHEFNQIKPKYDVSMNFANKLKQINANSSVLSSEKKKIAKDRAKFLPLRKTSNLIAASKDRNRSSFNKFSKKNKKVDVKTSYIPVISNDIEESELSCKNEYFSDSDLNLGRKLLMNLSVMMPSSFNTKIDKLSMGKHTEEFSDGHDKNKFNNLNESNSQHNLSPSAIGYSHNSMQENLRNTFNSPLCSSGNVKSKMKLKVDKKKSNFSEFNKNTSKTKLGFSSDYGKKVNENPLNPPTSNVMRIESDTFGGIPNSEYREDNFKISKARMKPQNILKFTDFSRKNDWFVNKDLLKTDSKTNLPRIKTESNEQFSSEMKEHDKELNESVSTGEKEFISEVTPPSKFPEKTIHWSPNLKEPHKNRLESKSEVISISNNKDSENLVQLSERHSDCINMYHKMPQPKLEITNNDKVSYSYGNQTDKMKESSSNNIVVTKFVKAAVSEEITETKSSLVIFDKIKEMGDRFLLKFCLEKVNASDDDSKKRVDHKVCKKLCSTKSNEVVNKTLKQSDVSQLKHENNIQDRFSKKSDSTNCYRNFENSNTLAGEKLGINFNDVKYEQVKQVPVLKKVGFEIDYPKGNAPEDNYRESKSNSGGSWSYGNTEQKYLNKTSIKHGLESNKSENQVKSDFKYSELYKTKYFGKQEKQEDRQWFSKKYNNMEKSNYEKNVKISEKPIEFYDYSLPFGEDNNHTKINSKESFLVFQNAISVKKTKKDTEKNADNPHEMVKSKIIADSSGNCGLVGQSSDMVHKQQGSDESSEGYQLNDSMRLSMKKKESSGPYKEENFCKCYVEKNSNVYKIKEKAVDPRNDFFKTKMDSFRLNLSKKTDCLVNDSVKGKLNNNEQHESTSKKSISSNLKPEKNETKIKSIHDNKSNYSVELNRESNDYKLKTVKNDVSVNGVNNLSINSAKSDLGLEDENKHENSCKADPYFLGELHKGIQVENVISIDKKNQKCQKNIDLKMESLGAEDVEKTVAPEVHKFTDIKNSVPSMEKDKLISSKNDINNSNTGKNTDIAEKRTSKESVTPKKINAHELIKNVVTFDATISNPKIPEGDNKFTHNSHNIILGHFKNRNINQKCNEVAENPISFDADYTKETNALTINMYKRTDKEGFTNGIVDLNDSSSAGNKPLPISSHTKKELGVKGVEVLKNEKLKICENRIIKSGNYKQLDRNETLVDPFLLKCDVMPRDVKKEQDTKNLHSEASSSHQRSVDAFPNNRKLVSNSSHKKETSPNYLKNRTTVQEHEVELRQHVLAKNSIVNEKTCDSSLDISINQIKEKPELAAEVLKSIITDARKAFVKKNLTQFNINKRNTSVSLDKNIKENESDKLMKSREVFKENQIPSINKNSDTSDKQKKKLDDTFFIKSSLLYNIDVENSVDSTPSKSPNLCDKSPSKNLTKLSEESKCCFGTTQMPNNLLKSYIPKSNTDSDASSKLTNSYASLKLKDVHKSTKNSSLDKDLMANTCLKDTSDKKPVNRTAVKLPLSCEDYQLTFENERVKYVRKKSENITTIKSQVMSNSPQSNINAEKNGLSLNKLPLSKDSVQSPSVNKRDSDLSQKNKIIMKSENITSFNNYKPESNISTKNSTQPKSHVSPKEQFISKNKRLTKCSNEQEREKIIKEQTQGNVYAEKNTGSVAFKLDTSRENLQLISENRRDESSSQRSESITLSKSQAINSAFKNYCRETDINVKEASPNVVSFELPASCDRAQFMSAVKNYINLSCYNINLEQSEGVMNTSINANSKGISSVKSDGRSLESLTSADHSKISAVDKNIKDLSQRTKSTILRKPNVPCDTFGMESISFPSKNIKEGSRYSINSKDTSKANYDKKIAKVDGSLHENESKKLLKREKISNRESLGIKSFNELSIRKPDCSSYEINEAIKESNIKQQSSSNKSDIKRESYGIEKHKDVVFEHFLNYREKEMKSHWNVCQKTPSIALNSSFQLKLEMEGEKLGENTKSDLENTDSSQNEVTTIHEKNYKQSEDIKLLQCQISSINSFTSDDTCKNNTFADFVRRKKTLKEKIREINKKDEIALSLHDKAGFNKTYSKIPVRVTKNVCDSGINLNVMNKLEKDNPSETKTHEIIREPVCLNNKIKLENEKEDKNSGKNLENVESLRMEFFRSLEILNNIKSAPDDGLLKDDDIMLMKIQAKANNDRISKVSPSKSSFLSEFLESGTVSNNIKSLLISSKDENKKIVDLSENTVSIVEPEHKKSILCKENHFKNELLAKLLNDLFNAVLIASQHKLEAEGKHVSKKNTFKDNSVTSDVSKKLETELECKEPLIFEMAVNKNDKNNQHKFESGSNYVGQNNTVKDTHVTLDVSKKLETELESKEPVIFDMAVSRNDKNNQHKFESGSNYVGQNNTVKDSPVTLDVSKKLETELESKEPVIFDMAVSRNDKNNQHKFESGSNYVGQNNTVKDSPVTSDVSKKLKTELECKEPVICEMALNRNDSNNLHKFETESNYVGKKITVKDSLVTLDVPKKLETELECKEPVICEMAVNRIDKNNPHKFENESNYVVQKNTVKERVVTPDDSKKLESEFEYKEPVKREMVFSQSNENNIIHDGNDFATERSNSMQLNLNLSSTQLTSFKYKMVESDLEFLNAEISSNNNEEEEVYEEEAFEDYRDVTALLHDKIIKKSSSNNAVDTNSKYCNGKAVNVDIVSSEEVTTKAGEYSGYADGAKITDLEEIQTTPKYTKLFDSWSNKILNFNKSPKEHNNEYFSHVEMAIDKSCHIIFQLKNFVLKKNNDRDDKFNTLKNSSLSYDLKLTELRHFIPPNPYLNIDQKKFKCESKKEFVKVGEFFENNFYEPNSSLHIDSVELKITAKKLFNKFLDHLKKFNYNFGPLTALNLLEEKKMFSVNFNSGALSLTLEPDILMANPVVPIKSLQISVGSHDCNKEHKKKKNEIREIQSLIKSPLKFDPYDNFFYSLACLKTKGLNDHVNISTQDGMYNVFPVLSAAGLNRLKSFSNIDLYFTKPAMHDNISYSKPDYSKMKSCTPYLIPVPVTQHAQIPSRSHLPVKTTVYKRDTKSFYCEPVFQDVSFDSSNEKGRREEKQYLLNLSIPLDKVTNFPLINEAKKKLKYHFKDVINIDYNSTSHGADVVNFPSVTKILNDTMSEKSRAVLEQWRVKMVAELGEEGFDLLNKAKLEQGSKFHDCIRQYLLGTPIEELKSVSPNVSELLKSLQYVLLKMSKIAVVESEVIHSHLPYRGYVDCVAVYNGKPTLIEWKHSDKKKPFLSRTYDAPIQMSAYLGALNYDKNYKLPVENGMVIVAYTDGSPADVFWLTNDSCHHYWKLWLERLHKFLLSRIN